MIVNDFRLVYKKTGQSKTVMLGWAAECKQSQARWAGEAWLPGPLPNPCLHTHKHTHVHTHWSLSEWQVMGQVFSRHPIVGGSGRREGPWGELSYKSLGDISMHGEWNHISCASKHRQSEIQSQLKETICVFKLDDHIEKILLSDVCTHTTESPGCN